MSEKLPDMAVDLFKYNIDIQMERGISIKNRTFTLTGEVNLDMFHRTESCMTIFESESAEDLITIKLCSEGGEIYSALAIIGRIKASPCQVRIEAFGQVMSAATAIFAVADERVANQYCVFMFHQASVELPELKTRDIRTELKQSELEDRLFSEILAKHSKEDVKFWNKMIESGRSAYLTAQQCVELGLADELN